MDGEVKGPHPPFGHLLPSSGREKAIISETIPFARSRFSEWEKVAEGRMRALPQIIESMP
jgi:hypothetical protein